MPLSSSLSSSRPMLAIIIPLPELKRRAKSAIVGKEDAKDSRSTDANDLALEYKSCPETTLREYGVVATVRFSMNVSATDELDEANEPSTSSLMVDAPLQFWTGDRDNYSTVTIYPNELVSVRKFLNNLYNLSASDNEDQAIDEVIDYFEDLLIRKEYRICNQVLRTANVKKLAASVGLAILSMTLVGKDVLPERKLFAARLRLFLSKDRNCLEQAELFSGLE